MRRLGCLLQPTVLLAVSVGMLLGIGAAAIRERTSAATDSAAAAAVQPVQPVQPVRPGEPRDPIPVSPTTATTAEPRPEPVTSPPTPPTSAEPAGSSGIPARTAAGAEAPLTLAAPPVPNPHIPLGKGMWLHQLSHAGSAQAVVDHARAVGLTHLYLRVGSSKMGFYGQEELDRLLPVAHAGGLKVVGWDFPYLFDPVADAERAATEIAYTTPDGHRMDTFSADIETAAEGVNLTPEGALAYGARLRELVGPDYPLIATVPRPSPKRPFPFAEATASFDAIAPMVYWMNRDPATDVAQAMTDLAPLGKPVLPIGQAYDGGPEGGPPGPPPRDHLDRFMDTALGRGAVGVSFWVWHHATAEHWAAIDEASAWELPPGDPPAPAGVAYLQRLLVHLGQPITVDGLLGSQTRDALAAVQQSRGLEATGSLDPPTLAALFGPRT